MKLFLFERVDEFDGGEEPDALAVMLDGLDADRRGEVRLAGSGTSDQDDVMGVLEELAAVELTRQQLVTSLYRRSRSRRGRDSSESARP